jgi:probable cytosol aminopeptidase
VALVGKGITFDTGGVSIKPAANMDQMISDMGGSAAVLATIIAAARLKLNVKVTATIPMAENMPGGNSYRPGDVITHYGGTTSEILNTDAEGRLILADAIARASEDNPDYLIETATLTGAQMVALGLRTAGVMGSDAFRDRVAETGRSVGEQAWAMPIPEEMSTAMSSPVADLRNADPSRWGGMLSAGYYLGNFVGEGIEWVHIDIAGPSFNTGGAHGYTPARATGAPVRTLIAVLEGIAGE